MAADLPDLAAAAAAAAAAAGVVGAGRVVGAAVGALGS